MKTIIYTAWRFLLDHPYILLFALAVVLVTILALMIVEIITTDRNAGSGNPRR